MLQKFIARHLGVYYMIVASALFAFVGAFAKILSESLPSIEVVFFRNIVGLILIIFALKKRPIVQVGGRFWLLFFRGLAGIISIIGFFYNIAHMGLGEAFTFSKTAPIFIALIAAMFLKERLSIQAWLAIFMGFVGILLIIQPQIGFTKTDLMGLINGFFAALAYTSMYELKKFYDTRVIVLSFVAVGTLVPFLFMVAAHILNIPSELDFAFSKFILPDFMAWIFIVLMGIFGVLYQMYLTKAFSVSKKAGSIAAVGYCDVIFSMVIGFAMGDALPNFIAFLGIMLVIISGIVVAKEK